MNGIEAMRVLNLTPHPVRMADAAGGIVLEAAPSGVVARVITPPAATGECCGLPYRRHVSLAAGRLDGLPSREEGTIYVVSLPCLDVAAAAGRDDVFAPGTGPQDGAIRNAEGHPHAVRIFVRACEPA